MLLYTMENTTQYLLNKYLAEQTSTTEKENCYCHILYNCARYACIIMLYNVKALVLKVFSEFSCSARRTAELKKCFVSVELQYIGVMFAPFG